MHILSLKPEVLLYIYLASCIAVLLFNLFYIVTDRLRGKRFEARGAEFTDVLLDEMRRMHGGAPIEQAHLGWLKRKLVRVEGLRGFEHSMKKAQETADKETAEEYRKQIRPVFLELAEHYSHRDDIERTYLASIIEQFQIDRGRDETDSIIEFLKQLVIGRDVYARENALRAIQSIGSLEAVIDVWEKMQDNGIIHSVKLLADGLTRFSGDKTRLAHGLMEKLKRFDVPLALPILQFIRFYSGDFCREMLLIVEDERADKELRLEGIRYFRRYRYEPAKEILIRFIRYQEYLDWEYGAMAALSLSSYPGEDTVACLKDGLRAYNWYVRLNCAEALVAGLEVPQSSLYDIYNGRDRYAREILYYVTEKEKIRSQEAGI